MLTGDVNPATARREGLKLVTEDPDLLKFPEAISLEAMLKELRP
jgi:hypothetical protein